MTVNKKIKLALVLFLACVAGCSATTLRCGSNGESSYVDLVNVPENLATVTGYYAELCSFAQKEPS